MFKPYSSLFTALAPLLSAPVTLVVKTNAFISAGSVVFASIVMEGLEKISIASAVAVKICKQ